MNPYPRLAPFFNRLERTALLSWNGTITDVVGRVVHSDGPWCAVGDCCEFIDKTGEVSVGEIVGFRGTTVLSQPLEPPRGLSYGDRIVSRGERPGLGVGEALIGHVIDGNGKPLDGFERPVTRNWRPLDSEPPLPLERSPISEPLGCGIRAIDSMLTCGRGQRVGIFGGSGVGKSTLIGMMARGTSADVTVLGLVGERGREVREFLEDVLGEEGRRRSVVVVATSDQSPLMRIRAALAATCIAESFCDQGRNVLLVVDSLTRLAMAQREIGLAVGEPPTAKGYTPSVFTLLAKLAERAGKFSRGSITAFYTVLMEGDDQQDPLVDGVRALLDGHILLDRRLASRGHYPPISVLDSVSRLLPAVTAPEHFHKVQTLRRLLAAYAASEDLVRLGAYARGADPELDQALTVIPKLLSFLQQNKRELAPIQASISGLLALGV